jgi:nucleotide-binding universal stress UspA family protein
MVALLLVAASLGLSNFAASVGIGVSGVDGRTRLLVGLVFGAFETAMPVIGLLLGRGLASALGSAAHWTGAGLLIATGLYALVQAVRDSGGHGEAEIASGAGVRYTFERVPGAPADAIIASARASADDGEPVIVVGRSGHAASHVLGSVPVRLLHHSPYPVLAIP